MLEIIVRLGGQAVLSRPLAAGELNLGSAPENDLVLDHPEVSPRHARVQLSDKGMVTIEDQGSKQGVWLEEKQVRLSMWLPGRPVKIGPYELELRREDAPAAPSPRAAAAVTPPPPPAARPSGKKYFAFFLLAGLAIAGAMAFMAYLDQEEKADQQPPAVEKPAASESPAR